MLRVVGLSVYSHLSEHACACDLKAPRYGVWHQNSVGEAMFCRSKGFLQGLAGAVSGFEEIVVKEGHGFLYLDPTE